MAEDVTKIDNRVVATPLGFALNVGRERALFRIARLLDLGAIDEEEAQRLRDLGREEQAQRLELSSPLPESADAADRAQDLLYDLVEDHRPHLLWAAWTTALYLDPDNLDARVGLALNSYRFGAEMAASFTRLFERGADSLHGSEGNARGWGHLDARPALRAKAQLARTLIETGDFSFAEVSLRQLLELDPTDTQRAGLVLYLLLLEQGRLEDARACRAGAFVWSAGDALQAYVALITSRMESAPDQESEALRARALELNDRGEYFLVHPEELPGRIPESYELGSESEAWVVGHLLWRIVHHHPDVLAWIVARSDATVIDIGTRDMAWCRIAFADQYGIPSGVVPFYQERSEEQIRGLIDLVHLGLDVVRGLSADRIVEGDFNVALVKAAHAAALAICRLRIEAAIPEIVTYLTSYETNPMPREDWLVLEAYNLGAPLAEALIDALETCGRGEVRQRVIETLARTQVRDEAIFQLLVAEVKQLGGAEASWYLRDYGDPRGARVLEEMMEERDDFTENVLRAMFVQIINFGESPAKHLGERYPVAFEAAQAQCRRDGEPETAAEVRRMHDEMVEIFERRRRKREEMARAREEDEKKLRQRWGPMVRFRSRYRKDVYDNRDAPGEQWGDTSHTVGSPGKRPGRNEPCWCGSGKKYKKCHLSMDDASA